MTARTLRQPVNGFLTDDLIVLGIGTFELRSRERNFFDRNALVKTQAAVIRAALQGIFLGLAALVADVLLFFLGALRYLGQFL